MNCRFCGTALPEGAVFCGECGRPASSVSGRRRASMPKVSVGRGSSGRLVAELDEPRPIIIPDPIPSPLADREPEPVRLDAVEPESAGPDTATCPQCGRVVLATDVFCGDCGFVLASARMPAPEAEGEPEPEPEAASEPEAQPEPEARPEPEAASEPEPDADPAPAVAVARDTAEIAPADLDFSGIVVHTAPREVALSGVALVDAEADEPGADEPGDAPEGGAAGSGLEESTEIADPLDALPSEPGVPVVESPDHTPPPIIEPEQAPLAAPSPFAPDPARLRIAAAAALTGDAEVGDPAGTPAVGHADPAKPLRAVPDPFPWGKGLATGPVDLEKTRAVATGPAEERFVLQFSTGESVTVTGAGLVGRNPSSQPGEFVDQLVTIFDAGKSVSKTHLEFGQDSGRFWVSDRYSTNGSTVRQPDLEPKRCEPGRRYFVARGTRVDIGEQFFVVS